MNVLKSGVKATLGASDVDFDVILGLNKLFSFGYSIVHALNGLQSERQQHKYYKENLGLGKLYFRHYFSYITFF